MKIFFCIVSSFFFIFHAFGLDNTNQEISVPSSVGENLPPSFSEITKDLSEDFYLKAMVNPALLASDGVILFTNARNEKNIKEWAAHHLLLGFDLIYIFDHKSDQPLIKEFENFDPRVIVERCEWENPVKMPLMNRAAVLAKQLNAKWMLYLDADEFLILNDFNHVKSLLDAYSHADSLGINWLLFGSNYHVKEPKGLVLDNYTRSDLILNLHVKSFVRPWQITQAINPHFYCIVNPAKMFSINNAVINGLPCFNEWYVEYFKSPAYIAHYIYQSEQTYFNRKQALPRDDLGEFRDRILNIHLYYNDFENLGPKEKYSAQVKKFLENQSLSEKTN